jgi:NhaA family Na+:H+ antiporter
VTAPAIRRYVDYLRVEQVGGLVLLAAATAALVLANIPARDWYEDLLGVTFGPDALGARLDVAHWCADGLLAVFFFVAGLEIKRELLVGELTVRRTAALPVLAAVGGMVGPALVYLAVAGSAQGAGRGWAVPTATDIAFALGVLAVAGSKAPVGLRLFLLSLAVVDDLGAIALIAVLYTDTVHLAPLAGAVVLLGCYALAQRQRLTTPLLYVPLALGVWLCVHDSGIHATVAGIALGLLTRVRPDLTEQHAPAERLEHRLQPWSAGLVVPLFAFTAAGVTVSGDAIGGAIDDPAARGVFLGLLVGKAVGVLGVSWLAVRLGLAQLPSRVRWREIAAVAALAGTGFTVSLLLTGLAFDDPVRREAATLAVLLASTAAALLGALVLRAGRGVHDDLGGTAACDAPNLEETQ